MATRIRPVIGTRDRFADWLVWGLVLLGLTLGWGVRTAVLNRTDTFHDPDTGIRADYPAGWRQTGPAGSSASWPGGDAGLLLRVHEPWGGSFPTTLELRLRPLAAQEDPRLVLESLSLARGRTAVAYKPLQTDNVMVDDRVASRRTFTFVQADNNPYLEQLPVVVLGADVVLPLGDGRALVATLMAQAERFEDEQWRLHDLLDTLQYP